MSTTEAVWLCANTQCTNEVESAGVTCPSCNGQVPTVGDRLVAAAQAMQRRAPNVSPADAAFQQLDKLAVEALGPRGAFVMQATGIGSREVAELARRAARAAFRTRRKL